MRTDPKRKMFSDDWLGDTEVATADYKDDPNEVLTGVDEQLAEHGLEVVMIDTGSDAYAWTIQKRTTLVVKQAIPAYPEAP